MGVGNKKHMEKFEQPRQIKQRESLEPTDEEKFQRYVEDLQFTPKDFEKRILDVGAGSAQFAKWAKEHGVSSEIYSLELIYERSSEYLKEKSKSVWGSAEDMPFKNNTFDLVISLDAIPQVFSGEEYKKEELKENVKSSFSEMLRVIKPGGEIRIGGMFDKGINEKQRQLRSTFNEIINEFKSKQDIAVEEIPNGYNIYTRDKNGQPKIWEKRYLIKIHKQT